MAGTCEYSDEPSGSKNVGKRRIYATMHSILRGASGYQEMCITNLWPQANWKVVWKNLHDTPVPRSSRAAWYRQRVKRFKGRHRPWAYIGIQNQTCSRWTPRTSWIKQQGPRLRDNRSKRQPGSTNPWVYFRRSLMSGRYSSSKRHSVRACSGRKFCPMTLELAGMHG